MLYDTRRKSVALISVVAAIFLTGFKLIIGIVDINRSRMLSKVAKKIQQSGS